MNKIILLGLFVFSCISLSAQTITTPPKALKLDSFYKRYLNANGIHIVCSQKVPDAAILKAYEIVTFMTNDLPKPVLKNMQNHGVRVGVMGRYEGTTDIPEHAYLKDDTTLNWDLRARGLGGDLDLPLTTCAEENLLCYQIDKYHAEDILIHEFAHTIHFVGIMPLDSSFNAHLKKCMDEAIAIGKYENTYAITNIYEYWAEGVQNWFNTNAEVAITDGKHNQVNTREEMKHYDPALYKIINKYFSNFKENPSCHAKENKYQYQP